MIRDGQKVRCEKCRQTFTFHVGKPGKVRECPACAVDVEPLVASDSDPEGNWVPMPRSKMPRFEFVSTTCNPREHGEARA